MHQIQEKVDAWGRLFQAAGKRGVALWHIHCSFYPIMDEKNTFDEDDGFESPKDLKQMFADAEQAIKKGFSTLGDWSEHAKDIFENRPGVVLASITIAGFMAGVYIRQGAHRKKMDLASDPVVVFITGAAIGLALGPKILKDLFPQNTPTRTTPYTDYGHH